MPWQRAAAASQQSKAIVEARQNFADRQQFYSRCSQFDGQGYAVEATAYFRKGSGIARVDNEAGRHQARAINEHMDRFGLAHGIEIRTFGQTERAH